VTTYGIDRSTSPGAAAAAAAATPGGTSSAEAFQPQADRLDELSVLTDPGADRILFWDESANTLAWLAADGTTVQISGTTLSVITGGVDHGGLTGLADDDHAQYLLASAATNRTVFATNWTDLTDAGETTLHIHDGRYYTESEIGTILGDYLTTAAAAATYQPLDADLTAIAALANTDSNFIVGNGTTWVVESGATARTSLGLGTGDSPQLTAIELGHATDTTLARVAAGVAAVEGKNLSRITSQSGVPGSTPTYVGELNVDTTNATAYIATGTASSADWEQIDASVGGVSDGDKGDITVSSSGTVWTIDPAAVTEQKLAAGATLKLGTEQATTSGTSIDFTGIPAGTKQIVVVLEGCSLDAAVNLAVQIGDSGGIENTGYSGGYAGFTGSGGGANQASGAFTGGMLASLGGAITGNTVDGVLVCTLKDGSNFTWTWQGAFFTATVNWVAMSTGNKSLSAELDRIRLTSTSGVPTFNAGSVNIAYK